MEFIRENSTILFIVGFLVSTTLIWFGWEVLGEVMEFVWDNCLKIAGTLILALAVTFTVVYLVNTIFA